MARGNFDPTGSNSESSRFLSFVIRGVTRAPLFAGRFKRRQRMRVAVTDWPSSGRVWMMQVSRLTAATGCGL